jgi:hypothetical protein
LGHRAGTNDLVIPGRPLAEFDRSSASFLLELVARSSLFLCAVRAGEIQIGIGSTGW